MHEIGMFDNEKQVEQFIKEYKSKQVQDPSYLGVSDFGILDEEFDDGTAIEPTFDPGDKESVKKRIFWAAQNGKLDELINLFNSELINITDEDGYTPLHRACYNDHANVVKYLCDNGANVRARTKDGWEPIHCASFWSNVKCVSILLNHNLPSITPDSLLKYTFTNTEFKNQSNDANNNHDNNNNNNDNNNNNNNVSVKYEHYDKNDDNITNNDSTKNRNIDKTGFVDIVTSHMINSRTNGGLTPLHLACQNNGSKETIEILLFHPFIDLTLKTPMGDTAYDIAKRKCPIAAYLFQCFDPSINPT